MTASGLRCELLLLLVLSAVASDALAEGMGVGALGDSLTDGSVAGGERWPEFMQSARGVDMGGPGEPYNVAVSAAAAILLADLPQTTHMVELVRAGDVAVPIVWIGGTEMLFTATAGLLQSSAWDGAGFGNFKTLIINEIMRAVDKVRAEGAADFIVVSIPDLADTPFAQEAGWSVQQRANVSRHVNALNAALVQEVAARGLTWVDFTGAFRDFFAQGLVVGGFQLRMGEGVGDQTYFFRDSVHPAIIGNVLMVGMFTQALNRRFGTTYAPFTDLEALTIAGIADRYAGETLLSAIDLGDYVTTFGLPLFGDGFESGGFAFWSTTVPAP